MPRCQLTSSPVFLPFFRAKSVFPDGHYLKGDSNMVKIASYYKKAHPGEHFTFWEDGIGLALPKKIATILQSECECIVIRDKGKYKPVQESDIAYCQLFNRPKKRPARFVYTIVSDVVGNEVPLKKWIDKVRPNLLLCLQTLDPDIVKFGRERGCSVEMFPWFVIGMGIDKVKDLTALCTGCTDPVIYPKRKAIADYLVSMNRNDVVVSCSSVFGNYRLSNDGYADSLSRCKYYFSGAIYDRFVPPKYYEAAACGACLVTFPVPGLEELGFVNGVTCAVINSLDEIEEVLASDLYITVGPQAIAMAESKHSLQARAEWVVEAYRRTINN
jgi:hypothetical protein